VGHGGEALAPAGSCVPVFQPCHVPAHPTWKWDAGSKNTGAIMSRNLEAASPAVDQENFLNQTFDRVSTRGLTVDGACYTLNDVYRALQGINAIGRILLANSVAEDCCVPTLSSNLVGGLMEGLNALSNMAINSIEGLADRAEQSDTETEVGHD
jgi:hypothetical protein